MSGKIGAELQSSLTDEIEVTVFLRENPAAEFFADTRLSPSARGFLPAVEEVKGRTLAAQEELLADLFTRIPGARAFERGTRDRGLQQLWINNLVCLKLPRMALSELVTHLGSREDVELVDNARYVRLEDLLDAEPVGSGVVLAAPPAAPPSPTANVRLIEAPQVWDIGITGKGVRVAVIDSGIDYMHPDLLERMWDGGPLFPHHGYDFGRLTEDPMDRDGNGHGTFCGGLVAGDGKSGEPITGVAPGATLMALRVGNAGGLVSDWSIWKAFEFAIEHRAHVLSMSLSWKSQQNPNLVGWRRASMTLLNAGILHANSAGNQGRTTSKPLSIGVPANCPPPRLHPSQTVRGGLASAIACGAIASGDTLVDPFSSRGPAAWEIGPFNDYPYAQGGLIKPDLCAPGFGIESCRAGAAPGSSLHDHFGGTSAAAAQVAGCMALLVEASLRTPDPPSPARIQEALEAGAEKFLDQAAGSKEDNFGAGKVRVFKAFKYGEAQGFWATPPPPSPPPPAPGPQGQRGEAAPEASPDKLSPALRSLLNVRAAQQREVDLTVILKDGLDAAAVQGVLGALAALGASAELLERLGFVLFIGPLGAVPQIAALAEVLWIDLASETGLHQLHDLL